MYCLECDCPIQKDVFNYSTKNFDVPLCRQHQTWFKKQLNKSTPEAIYLYFALKEYGVPAELEKHDGYKTVDIVIEDAKVHIEVDGGHHNYDNRQALADLRRTYYSFLDGYFTLRIPNSLIRWNLDVTTEEIVAFLKLNKKKVTKKGFSVFNLFK
jgi:hypothetical protein